MHELRVGLGHDTHRLKPGGPLRLGGIDIPHDHEAVGHSDADALLHAVVDALLGAAALGDIGQMFPDTDPVNRGRDSGRMLSAARRRSRRSAGGSSTSTASSSPSGRNSCRTARRFASGWPKFSASSPSGSA